MSKVLELLLFAPTLPSALLLVAAPQTPFRNFPSSARSSLGRIVSQGGDPTPPYSVTECCQLCLSHRDFLSLEFEPWLVEPKMKTSKSWCILLATAQRSCALEISLFLCFTWALSSCCASFLVKLVTVHLGWWHLETLNDMCPGRPPLCNSFKSMTSGTWWTHSAWMQVRFSSSWSWGELSDAAFLCHLSGVVSSWWGPGSPENSGGSVKHRLTEKGVTSKSPLGHQCSGPGERWQEMEAQAKAEGPRK